MSFPRHEYFRRVFCNLLGREVENGELPDDEALLGTMVQNASFRNAKQYFGFGLGATSKMISAPSAAASSDSG
jgi:glucuronate isomerase